MPRAYSMPADLLLAAQKSGEIRVDLTLEQILDVIGAIAQLPQRHPLPRADPARRTRRTPGQSTTTESEGGVDERLVKGMTLADRMREGPLNTSDVLQILRPIADALDTAHALGLIHRDVKPQNILLSARGEVFLADFGVAKAEQTDGLTNTGSFVGSFNYAAPEQALGEPTTAATDVYALTAVLYQCLTGQVPYPRDTSAGVLLAHINAPRPRVEGPQAEAFNALLARGLAKDRDSRYQNAGDLLAATEDAVSKLSGAEQQAKPVLRPVAGEAETVPPLTTPSVTPSQLEGTKLSGPADGTKLSGPVDGTKLSGPVDGTKLSGPVDGTKLSGPVDGTKLSGPVDGTKLSGPVDGTKLSARAESTTISSPVESPDVPPYSDSQSEAGDEVVQAGEAPRRRGQAGSPRRRAAAGAGALVLAAGVAVIAILSSSSSSTRPRPQVSTNVATKVPTLAKR